MGVISNTVKTLGNGLVNTGVNHGSLRIVSSNSLTRNLATGAINNLDKSSKHCIGISETRDIVDALDKGDFSKAAVNAAILSSVAGGSSV